MKRNTTIGLTVAASLAGVALLMKLPGIVGATELASEPLESQGLPWQQNDEPSSLTLPSRPGTARSVVVERPLDGAARGAVASLAEAIRMGDGEAAGRIAVEFFAQGPEALPEILELAASTGLDPDEVRGLGVLFRVGAHRLIDQPGRLEPWTIDTFAAASIELLSAHPQVPSLLYTGFGDLGLHLDAGHLPTLLDSLRSRDVGPAAESQFPCLQLAKQWATSMDASVEPLLIARTTDSSQPDVARADAAAMFLARDWRRAAVELAAVLDSESASELDALMHVASSHVLELDPFDQANYFMLTARSPELALATAAQMEPTAAELALEGVDDTELGQFHRTVLRLRAGSIEDGDEIFDALADRARTASLPQLTTLALRALVASDAAFEEGMSARLVARFTETESDRERFLKTLTKESRTMDEARLFAVVLPILDLTRDDTTRQRRALAATVTRRYPELRFD